MYLSESLVFILRWFDVIKCYYAIQFYWMLLSLSMFETCLSLIIYYKSVFIVIFYTPIHIVTIVKCVCYRIKGLVSVIHCHCINISLQNWNGEIRAEIMTDLRTTNKLFGMYHKRGNLNYFYVLLGFRELGCYIHDSLPFIPRTLVNHELQTVQGNSRKSLYNQEQTLNTLISKITINKVAMNSLVDTNHINELTALQNLIKIFDVDTTMEKYTLSWHDNHEHAVVRLYDRHVSDSNWYRSTKNVGEGWVSDGPIILDFSRTYNKVGNVEDFSILLMHLMAIDHTFVEATSENLVKVYKLFRAEMGKFVKLKWYFFLKMIAWVHWVFLLIHFE